MVRTNIIQMNTNRHQYKAAGRVDDNKNGEKERRERERERERV